MEVPEADAPLALHFPARAAALRGVREALRERLAAWGLDDTCIADVVMAVDEACQNVIRHAYRGKAGGRIELEVSREPGELRILLRDFAPPVDPRQIRPRHLDDLRPGGLGTHLIRSAMDETVLTRAPSGHGNLLKMVKKLG
jgi:sigma-B regulation protein RsbU (phosphoserine phosphatase)